MSPERIKGVLDRKPFEPFTVYAGDGGSVDVLSREFAFLHPGGRTLLIAKPRIRSARDEKDFEDHVIDVFLITKLIMPPRREGGRRKAS